MFEIRVHISRKSKCTQILKLVQFYGVYRGTSCVLRSPTKVFRAHVGGFHPVYLSLVYLVTMLGIDSQDISLRGIIICSLFPFPLFPFAILIECCVICVSWSCGGCESISCKPYASEPLFLPFACVCCALWNQTVEEILMWWREGILSLDPFM